MAVDVYHIAAIGYYIMGMDEVSYRAKIDALIDASNGGVELNGSHNHATIILERMFTRGSKSVKILTRYLDPRIYFAPDTIGAAKRFASSPQRSIEILVEEMDENTRQNLKVFDGYNVTVLELLQELKDPVRVNFAVMDDRGYRLELDQTGTKAIVAFGDEKLTPRLTTIFESLLDLSKPKALSA